MGRPRKHMHEEQQSWYQNDNIEAAPNWHDLQAALPDRSFGKDELLSTQESFNTDAQFFEGLNGFGDAPNETFWPSAVNHGEPLPVDPDEYVYILIPVVYVVGLTVTFEVRHTTVR